MNLNKKNASNGQTPDRRSSRGQFPFSALRSSCSIVETIKSNATERINAVDTRYSQADTRTHSKTTLIPLAEIEEREERVDLGDLMFDDEFKKLKSSDPFLFYSIPEVKKRSFMMTDDFDSSDDDSDSDDEEMAPPARPVRRFNHVEQVPLLQQEQKEDPPARARSQSSAIRNMSCPAGMLANADMARSLFEGRSTVVPRSRRLSVESHPNLVVDDIMSSMRSSKLCDFDEEYDDIDGSDSDEEFDETLKRVLNRMNSKSILGRDEH